MYNKFVDKIDIDFVNLVEGEFAKFKVISSSSVKLGFSVKSKISLKILEHAFILLESA